MSRSLPSPSPARSRVRHIRLRLEEDTALQQLARTLHQTPSRVLRRLLREAVTGGPDFFDEGVIDLRMLHRQVAAIGRNLNQLVRAANRGEVLAGEDVRRVLNATRVQLAAVQEIYSTAVRAAVQRTVVPLCEEAGLPSPFTEVAEQRASARRPIRPAGRSPGREA